MIGIVWVDAAQGMSLAAEHGMHDILPITACLDLSSSGFRDPLTERPLNRDQCQVDGTNQKFKEVMQT